MAAYTDNHISSAALAQAQQMMGGATSAKRMIQPSALGEAIGRINVIIAALGDHRTSIGVEMDRILGGQPEEACAKPVGGNIRSGAMGELLDAIVRLELITKDLGAEIGRTSSI